MSISLSKTALKVLEARYLRRDCEGQTVETPEEMFRRVAQCVAAAETPFEQSASAWAERFFQTMTDLEFLPNSPTLMNAGTPLGQLSACFVLPVPDSMAGIFESLKLMALVQQSGGGTGFSFSQLRPAGDPVSSTGGTSSGPVSFMRIFDSATENIRQGGKRRGANMGVLRVDHPDIFAFVDAKIDGTSFHNFNLSVAITDEFLAACQGDKDFALRHPRSGQVVRRVSAQTLMQHIADAAWKSGDPGVIFIDTINRAHPTPDVGAIEATNPCGEVPLLPYEACNLGSINLARMVRREGNQPTVDWKKLGETARLGIRFLDDVIEVNHAPAEQIGRAIRANRKVGLGVMGLADLFIQLGVPYASNQAIELADELMRFLAGETLAASRQLASERGVFPNWQRSTFARQQVRVRHATTTSIAPTGTLSMLAGTSASIEPLFALAYRREHVLKDETLMEMHPIFVDYAQTHGFDSEKLAEVLCQQGTLAQLEGVPADAKRLFATALEIDPTDHLRMQAAFQKHVDNAVSKTVNLSQTTTPDEIAAIYREAASLHLKGVTVYRYGSRGQQVFNLGLGERAEEYEHFANCDPHACKL